MSEEVKKVQVNVNYDYAIESAGEALHSVFDETLHRIEIGQCECLSMISLGDLFRGDCHNCPRKVKVVLE